MDAEQRLTEFLERERHHMRLAGPKNSIVKHVQSLINNTKPNPRKLFVLEGIWAFNMALRADISVVSFVLCPGFIHSNEAFELVESYHGRAQDTYLVSERVFQSLSERDQPDGLLAVCEFPLTDPRSIRAQDAIVLVLDGLEIPGNIGTIIRSADAANADAIFICNRRARLTHPKLIKGSMGAVFFKPIVEFESVESCQQWLDERGFSIYLADTRAQNAYHQHAYAGNTALIVGSERYGITKSWYREDAHMVSIPMLGQCDSLNVAIATTIILYEMRLKKDGLR